MTGWPAEWAPHRAVWIGFPGNPAEWPDDLAGAQQEVADFARAVWQDGEGEEVLLICRSEQDAETADRLTNGGIAIRVESFGDIWLRDTGPIIINEAGRLVANRFGFNGWGGKFPMTGDGDIGARLAAREKLPVVTYTPILEGGAIDGDGAGWLITTEQCVLNANRNRRFTKADAERLFTESLLTKRTCWLGEGLMGDHTDGHVDNLARFVAEAEVVIPAADQKNDPNHAIFDDAAVRARAAGLTVHRAPSVGRFEMAGQLAPASYMNFYIGNRVVVVPQYGQANDAAAVSAVAELFPGRMVVGLPSTALLRGGGSFHCISQQIPAH